MEPLVIKSAQGQYPVEFIDRLTDLRQNLSVAGTHRVFLVDSNVMRLHREALGEIIGAYRSVVIEATELEKTLDGCSRVLRFLQEQDATRQTEIVALGGGVVQDIVTFAAHVYYRGLRWIYLPTTLLGMADSCIGAKASINFNGFKNQLGVFHSPSRVVICEEFLRTLPPLEMRSGYGEIFKLHLLRSSLDFEKLTQHVSVTGFEPAGILPFVRASLAFKKAVIEVDEFDTGVRRNLNFGHTFGHALEALTEHGVPHGIAVAWGMDLVNWISVQRGLLTMLEFVHLHAIFQRHFGFSTDRDLTALKLLNFSRRDKKNVGGRLMLVLLRTAGKSEITPQDYDEQIVSWIEEYLSRYSIITAARAEQFSELQ